MREKALCLFFLVNVNPIQTLANLIGMVPCFSLQMVVLLRSVFKKTTFSAFDRGPLSKGTRVSNMVRLLLLRNPTSC